jgi:hypothetical protein
LAGRVAGSEVFEMLKNYEYKSDFARKWFGAGLREAVLSAARLQVPNLSDELVRTLSEITEPRQLRELHGALIVATTAEAAIAAIETFAASSQSPND